MGGVITNINNKPNVYIFLPKPFRQAKPVLKHNAPYCFGLYIYTLKKISITLHITLYIIA